MAVEKSKSEQRSLYASKIFHRKSFFCFHSNEPPFSFLPDIAQLPKPTSENSKIKTKFSSEISGIQSGTYFFILYFFRAIKIDNAGVFHKCSGPEKLNLNFIWLYVYEPNLIKKTWYTYKNHNSYWPFNGVICPFVEKTCLDHNL